MSCLTSGTSLVAVFAFVTLGLPTRSWAETCSASEQHRIDARRKKAVGDLKAGNLAGYRELLRSPDSQLSPACRKAQERDNPVSVKCTQTEKSLILSGMGAVMEAARFGNVDGVLTALEALQEHLSRECWTATNYSVDPDVQQACSATELSHMASASSESVAAFRALVTTGDVSPLLQVTMQVLAGLSQECTAALMRSQQAAQQRWGANPPPGVSNVYDHGGGTYSMPGVGACTPSGCMAF